MRQIVSPVKRANAKKMRREPTDAERALWSILRNRQFGDWKFRRQVPIGPYIADFLCYEARLIIEADGGQHASSPYDANRDAWLKHEGFAILRFWNNDLLTNAEGVASTILTTLNTSPSRGEGISDGAPLG